MAAPARRVFLRVHDGTEINIRTPDTIAPSQYPSEWFSSNEGLPSLVVPDDDKTMNTIAVAARREIIDSSVNVHVAKAFLFKYFSNVTAKLDADWISYGRTIAAARTTVNPFSFVNINREGVVLRQAQTTTACDETQYNWMAMVLLSPARMCRVYDDTYYDTIKDRIFAQMRTLGCDQPAYPAKTFHLGWDEDENFCKMAAAIDMFFNKFADHRWSKFRICTLSSRFKDCSGLISVGFLARILGFKLENEILDWVYSERVAQELSDMMRGTDYIEMNQHDSYFHYQDDLRLCKKYIIRPLEIRIHS